MAGRQGEGFDRVRFVRDGVFHVGGRSGGSGFGVRTQRSELHLGRPFPGGRGKEKVTPRSPPEQVLRAGGVEGFSGGRVGSPREDPGPLQCGGVIESLRVELGDGRGCGSVSLIALPLQLDQPLNARLAVELGVGVEVKKEGAGGEGKLIRREEVAKTIREMMTSVNHVVRGKAKEMSGKMRAKGDGEIDVLVEKLIELCNYDKLRSRD